MNRRQRNPRRSNTTEAQLQEQVRLLTTENDRLRATIIELENRNILQPTRQNENENNVLRRSRRGAASAQRPIAVATASNTPKALGKGCSCKGNCSNRQCGCVKNTTPCMEFCRCEHDSCQNQEPDKENIGDPNNQAQLSKEGQENLEKLAQLSLNDNNEPKAGKSSLTPPLNKRVKKVTKPRSIFSPGPTNDVFNFDDGEFENISLRFGDDAQRETESADEATQSRVEREKETKQETNDTTTSKHEMGRSRRQNLQLLEPEKKLRSLSNKENSSGESEQGKKVPTRRSISVEERSSKRVTDKPVRTLSQLLNGQLKPLRRPTVPKPGKSNKKRSHSRIKTKKATEQKGKKYIPVENDNSTDESSSEPDNRDDIEQTPAREIENHSVVKIEIESESELETGKDTNEPNQENPSGTSRDSGNSEAGPSTSHASSDVASGTDSSFNLEASGDFDPMKPRHKLSRSPPNMRKDFHQLLDLSERPLPIPPQEEPVAIDLPPPAELKEVVVDWDKHQADRVRCRKCGRGFYPHRVKKHEKICHKY